jgi:hypothetical protein
VVSVAPPPPHDVIIRALVTRAAMPLSHPFFNAFISPPELLHMVQRLLQKDASMITVVFCSVNHMQ